MRRILGAVLVALTLTSPAQAAETIATLPNESWIRSVGDRHLVQVREEAGYRLMTIEDRELLPLDEIQPSRYPFEADLGTMRQGEPAIVFSRCADFERRSCDLYLHEIASPGVRKLRAANTRASETAPTLWRGRLAWVRNRRVAMTRRVGSRGPSRTLFTAPRGTYSVIEELELDGRWLGVDLEYGNVPDDAPHREVRLLSLGGRNRLLDHSVGALSGHDFGGLSFWGDRFGWHRSCVEDECPGEAYRYDQRTHAKQVARIGDFDGFALSRDGFVGVTSGTEIGDDECDIPCEVVLERRVPWRRDGS
jgi:hypothetical protein